MSGGGDLLSDVADNPNQWMSAIVVALGMKRSCLVVLWCQNHEATRQRTFGHFIVSFGWAATLDGCCNELNPLRETLSAPAGAP